MERSMKFAVIEGKGKLCVKERKLRAPAPKEVLLKNRACNICTADYGQWLGLRDHQGFPMAPGHEHCGVILEKGEEVPDDFSIGDYVAAGYEYCGECEACMEGHTYECSGYDFPVRSEDGYYGTFGCSDYMLKDYRALYKISPKVEPSEAAFLEPLGTAVQGIRRLHARAGETALVIGAGTMGLLNAQVLRAEGCRVLVSELLEKKKRTAQAMGFEVIDASKEDIREKVMQATDQKGADMVIVAVGNEKANKQALEVLKKSRGRILFFAAGYPAPALPIDSNVIHYGKMELIGTYGADASDFQYAAELMNNGKVELSHLVEKRFTLDEIFAAYEFAAAADSYRVSIIF